MFAKVITPHSDRGFVHIGINYSIILIATFEKPFFKVSKKSRMVVFMGLYDTFSYLNGILTTLENPAYNFKRG